MQTTNQIIDAINAAVVTLNDNGCNYQVFAPQLGRMKEFINVINPDFPTDSVDVLDLLNVAVSHGSVPSEDEIDILKMILRDADFYHGNIRWKYRHPVLTAQFSPKHSGGFYEIHFIPLNKDGAEMGTFPLTFPLKVRVLIYTDMDKEVNHGDYCPVYHPEHDEDCPLRLAYESGNIPETDTEQAALEEECECASDTCDCSSSVERIEEAIFNRFNEGEVHTCSNWETDIVPFLLKAHWGSNE